MKISVKSLSDDKTISISELTLEDFRSISFMIDKGDDMGLYEFLLSKIETPCNAFDKFYLLLKARMSFVSENVTFNNSKSNVSININTWVDILEKTYEDISHDIVFENFKVSVNYPEHLVYNDYNNIITDCIYKISINDTELEFSDLTREDKNKVVEKLPPSLIILIKDYISPILTDKLVIMNPVLDLPEISVNVFDGSAFELIRILFNYYNYDEIIELVFMLSKRISDIGYINSRTPSDLDLLVKLYSEEVEKTSSDDKSYIYE